MFSLSVPLEVSGIGTRLALFSRLCAMTVSEWIPNRTTGSGTIALRQDLVFHEFALGPLYKD